MLLSLIFQASLTEKETKHLFRVLLNFSEPSTALSLFCFVIFQGRLIFHFYGSL